MSDGHSFFVLFGTCNGFLCYVPYGTDSDDGYVFPFFQ